MLISYEWLKDYVQIKLSPEELANKIEKTSVEVDSVFKRSDGLKKIVVGQILSIKDHPDADHLHITQVDVGEDEPIQIVCGAPNVEIGKKVIVALSGARIADNVKIKKSKMRGVESNGMLCALDEIGFDKSIIPDEWKDGIYFLPDNARVGDEVYNYLGMNESLIDLDVTPNRGDMLSVRGTAYDLGAVFDEKVNFIEHASAPTGTHDTDELISAKADPNLAPIYKLKVVENVDVKPSPLWLQIKLWNSGIKPINNIVDITNFIMVKVGQPMHAYDLDKLNSKDLEVRNAKDGEVITTLDGNDRKLTSTDVVIADDKPIALAGLMGGKDTEVTSETKNIVFEAGVFDPVKTRKMAQKQLLHTDASQRFERGVDHGNVEAALEYAAGMAEDLANGESEQGVVNGSNEEVQPRVISISASYINHVLGTNLSVKEIVSIFKRLGFGVEESGDNLTVTVPTRCWDLKIDADLVEEVARIYGYDNIPSTLPITQTTEGGLTPKQEMIRKSRETLEGLGLTHAMSYSLTTQEKAKMFMLRTSSETPLQWPMTEDHAILRMNLISGLLDDVAYNQARNVLNVPLYEQGRVFYKQDEDQVRPDEVEHIAGAISGSLVANSWDQKAKPVDFYQIKGILEKYLASLSLKGHITYVSTDKMADMHPGRTALIKLDDHLIGFIGEVHPKVAKQFKIKETYVFELDLDYLYTAPKSGQQYQKVGQYPAIHRDIAMLVDENVTNADINKLITRRGGAYLQDATVFDVYQGSNVPEGKKSIAYSLTFEDPNATLKDETVDKAVDKIQKRLTNELNAEIR
ncbi:phenylalanine--tRNA ligase subunit beta [Fructilactobacillus fructivorans]|uniref:Phenylalanine--tRNA ligase beta subunit n=1 Tax=Fructilactobacillus fructivorans TaxID=1614 RepID=A0A0C1LZ15_9LACO|nr:phenylalanine--tRNA ligase subunit beta [Fructilactobacillus fructivorans]KID42125.1 Phenylalanyl-tRNA synthetase beta chain [Fructilactobacillus fructivorans]MCT0152017.1 phenylalanine--tRNA ligase subunit beta [Fructilactobacillus fructivorans]MCT2867909.1 phenylalanine--tRNA ligase subunit beta [Fructilactobacillus fructivorans]MCT2868509.1 phenylalanine--tRNA ligase subunit beta [Fructilactobacillus fructivorans]MCT2873509.1 phenylalanine--tRNA ligase subunit beta [Fructilactobacillus f